MRTRLLWVVIGIGSATAMAAGQNLEATAMLGGQINGGVDLSTSQFNRINVGSGLTWGLGLGYLFGQHYGAEFMWSYNKADTVAQPVGGGPNTKLFTLDTNQYFGNFLYHFGDREKPLRPFLLGGLGATNLSPAVPGVHGVTRFVFAVGGGVKYNFTKHFGVRVQAKWSPTYLTTTKAGYWCDPFWGGCWVVGNSHYLNEYDGTVGLILRY